MSENNTPPTEISNTLPTEISNKIPTEISNTLPIENSNTLPTEISNTLPIENSNKIPTEISNTLPIENSNKIPTEISNTLSTEISNTLSIENSPIPQDILTVVENYKSKLEKINPIMYNFNDKPLIEEDKIYNNPYEKVVIPKKEKKIKEKKVKVKKIKKEDVIDFTGVENICRDYMKNMCIRENCRFIHDPQYCLRFFKNKSCKYRAGCKRFHYIKKEILEKYYNDNPDIKINTPILNTRQPKLYNRIIENTNQGEYTQSINNKYNNNQSYNNQRENNKYNNNQSYNNQRENNNYNSYNQPLNKYNNNQRDYTQNIQRENIQYNQRDHTQRLNNDIQRKGFNVKPYDDLNTTVKRYDNIIHSRDGNYNNYNNTEKLRDNDLRINYKAKEQTNRFNPHDERIRYTQIKYPYHQNEQVINTNTIEFQMNQLKLENERLKQQLSLIK